ncbi:E3 ubiquitin-protein ligase RGLG3-like protein [Drosera capensis]
MLTSSSVSPVENSDLPVETQKSDAKDEGKDPTASSKESPSQEEMRNDNPSTEREDKTTEISGKSDDQTNDETGNEEKKNVDGNEDARVNDEDAKTNAYDAKTNNEDAKTNDEDVNTNDEDAKTSDEDAKTNGADANTSGDSGQQELSTDKTKTDAVDNEQMVDENPSDISKQDKGDGSSNEKKDDKERTSSDALILAAQSELLNETSTQTGFWSTQAAESQNEKKAQAPSGSEEQGGHSWKLCGTTAGPDFIPCLDNVFGIRRLRTTKHYEHRERHCPEEPPTCLVPLPEGYRRQIKWPTSRERIWYNNVPHTKLVEVKGHQNWVKVSGEYLSFPGGGTQFKHGALHYIEFIENVLRRQESTSAPFLLSKITAESTPFIRSKFTSASAPSYEASSHLPQPPSNEASSDLHHPPTYEARSHSAQPPHFNHLPQPSAHGASSSYLNRNQFAHIADNFTSLDQVTSALREAGLESSNLILGMDFTKRNTGQFSFNHKNLHAIGTTPNPYEQAISIIGCTLSPFDDDGLIPYFGFGDATTHDIDVFGFYPDLRPCRGFEEALDRCREITPLIKLSGPTSSAPVIDAAIGIVEESRGQYHVLVIVADGQVTRSLDVASGRLGPQEQDTIRSIVAASFYPLSIVLIGVGDGPWETMKQFDDNIPQRAFDNFQFVNFTKIISENKDTSNKEAAFALGAVMEIPFQYGATLHLQGIERKSMVHRRPPPPPTEVIDHDNALRAIPQMTTQMPTQSVSVGEPVSVEQSCPICLTRPKNMAFQCGHTTCTDCGAKLERCHLCREPIMARIRLFI